MDNHHIPDHYLSLAQHLHLHSKNKQTVWGNDHHGAYRQLPLQDPEVAYVLLQTPKGPTLWHHHVLLFGSAASIWAYYRFGDMLTHISRCLRGIPVLHYVDDYGSISQSSDSDSSFNTFAELNSVLRFHIKNSKEQPPAEQRKIQGVIIRCSEQHITVQPCPDRVRRLLTELHNHIQTRNMSPEQARRLAGKCSFTTTQLFGRVGRSPLTNRFPQRTSSTQTHTHKDSHHSIDRDPSSLSSQNSPSVTISHQDHNYIHRRILLRRRQDMQEQRLRRT